MIKAVLDSCVLYPAQIRDVLLSIASVGCYLPLWSENIHKEWTSNLLKNRDDLTKERLQNTVNIMDRYFEDSNRNGFNSIIPSLTLPDPDDRHVLALAVHERAEFIVTNNISDFPVEVLSDLGVEAIAPNQFIVGLIEKGMRDLVVHALNDQHARLRNPPLTKEDFIEQLKRCGLGIVSSILDTE